MPNSKQIDAKRKHRKRKLRKQNIQNELLSQAGKRKMKQLHKEGLLPKRFWPTIGV
tara:strand:+ start:259 stop:426 length:168 start_codon:yes stop_codon:yes gene_type:complete